MKRDSTAEEVEREHTEYGEETLPPPPPLPPPLSLLLLCVSISHVSLCHISHTEQLHRDQFSKLVMQARERRKGGEREGDRAKARWTRDREEDTYESSNSDTDER